MRFPLNTQAISGYEFMEITDQNSGLPGSDGVKRHIGKDFVANVGRPLYAPESGTIINTWAGRQNVAGGNIIELQGTYTHRFLHLNLIAVGKGQVVSEGEYLGTTGNSGNVGAHLHHDVRKNGTAWNASLYNYVNFSTLIKGVNEVANRDQVNNLYKGILMREGDPGGLTNYTGRDANTVVAEMLNSGERKNLENHYANLQQGLKDSQAAVAAMQAKINELSLNPTKADYAAVQAELGDKLTELSATQTELELEQKKIKEKIVYTHDEETKKNVATIKGMLVNFIGYVKRKLGK